MKKEKKENELVPGQPKAKSLKKKIQKLKNNLPVFSEKSTNISGSATVKAFKTKSKKRKKTKAKKEQLLAS